MPQGCVLGCNTNTSLGGDALGTSPCAQAEATNFLAKQDTPVL